MTNLTIAWIALPFFIGFIIYLLPQFSRWLALAIALVSLAYSAEIFFQTSPLDTQLLDNFGVTLSIDQLSGFFILTNALVTLAVIAYCWQTAKTAIFYMQMIILHGSVNAAFICNDFISLYVALEVISIAAFLLIAYPRSDKSIWVGLRYLFVSNTAMLFYLVGTVLVYQAHHSFSFAGLRGSPPEAVALIFLGLLVKGGVFVSGLWLPITYSASESPVSAMLAGIVGKAAIYPLLRCALLLEEIDPLIRIFGIFTALFGVLWAILAQDTKRTLGFSSISQLGFMLAAPIVGGFYALTHGLAKSALFLMVGLLPSRDFKQLQSQSIDTKIWLVLGIASLSISGFPLLAGFSAKVLTSNNLFPWQNMLINIAAVGTAITYAKFIFLSPIFPLLRIEEAQNRRKVNFGFLSASGILILSLILANGFYVNTYVFKNLFKSLLIIGVGWSVYLLFVNKLIFNLPQKMEKLEHLIGSMSLMLIVVFWLVKAWSEISV